MKTKGKRIELFVRFYHVISGCCLTGPYIKRVRETLYFLCPIEEQQLRKLAGEICMITAVSICMITYLLFVRNPGVYTFSLSCFYSAVMAIELLRLASKQIERRVLKQTEKMLNDVRHFYYDTHSIRAALQEAASGAGYEMQVHIDCLLDVLEAEDVEAAAEEYNRTSGNRFLKLFLSQCVAIQEYGDTEKNGESVFVRNLSDLREDILNHLLQLERLQLEFAGLTFISLVPLLVLPLIRTTAVDTLPELSGFYSGTLGRVLPIVFLVVTVVIYSCIVEMQELDAQSNKHRWISQVEKNVYISRILDRWEKRHYGKVMRQKQRLRRAGEQITPRLLFEEKVLWLLGTVVLGTGVLVCVKGADECFRWYEAGILLLSGAVSYCIPDLRIWYRESLMQMNMMSEVTQFQSIILMQMFIPDITVLRLLTTMEQFARVFRASIQDCINEYSYSVQGALEKMKIAEGYEPFRRLCDNLLTVDKIGIIRSFEEIVQDRIHFQKQREADTYRMIKKKSEYAKMIAFIPMLLIMTAYLIFPYGAEAVRQFSMILEELNRL